MQCVLGVLQFPNLKKNRTLETPKLWETTHIVQEYNFEPTFSHLATGLMGFCACFQFGSGITWLSSNIPHMSSKQVSFIFLGSNMANCVFPALASKLFNDFGPNWVFYLTLISLLLTILCFLAMCALAKYRASK